MADQTEQQTGTEEKTPQEKAVEKAERLAKQKELYAQTLYRGTVAGRLEVPDGDPGRVYVWVRTHRNGIDIQLKHAQGARLERREDHPSMFEGEELRDGQKLPLHGDATDHIIVGDLILMSFKREDHEIMREVFDELRFKRHGKPGQVYYEEVSKDSYIPTTGKVTQTIRSL